MEHLVAEGGRIHRKSSSSFEGPRTGKHFTKPEGKEGEASRSVTEPQTKKEAMKQQGREAWTKKKPLPLDARKPCATKPPSCTPAARRPGTLILAPSLESVYQPQPQRLFSAQEAQQVMKAVLERTLQDRRHEGPGWAQLALDVAEEVKQSIRDLGYERYKLVCYVVLGPAGRTGLSCSSRSLWSPASDTYAEYVFRNSRVFAVCVVFAGYYE
ncbi:dynein light chain Tctex-type 5-B-like [Lissotriton helveticus]